jgi:hypothetical protein
VVDRTFGRKIVGQMIPLTSGLQYVDKGVQHFAHVRCTWPAAPFRGWNQRLQERPLLICQVVRVWFPVHFSSLVRHLPLFKWLLTQLYGSALSAEEIEDFYDAELSDGGWNRVRLSYLPEDSLIYGLSSRYSLAINIDPSQSIVRDSFFDYNYADDVDPNALESYGTLFITTLVYVAGPGCEFPEE